ncbi:MAG: hypothetical protein HYR74_13440 [Candidatus Eisenbacteria bacterium]|nr:hypothetical protein [Candidatus Eisenbacteria bacterium]
MTRRALSVMVVVAVIGGVRTASAVDIEGKWGIGAGLFTGGGEASLIRGHSNRTAYVFDVRASGATDGESIRLSGLPAVGGNSNQWLVGAGPTLRHFMRPEADLSPYGDVFVTGTYSHRHDSTGPRNVHQWAVSTGVAFGVEYFTRWHCSVAAHSGLFRVTYADLKEDIGTAPGLESVTDTRWSFDLGISPMLFARVYF